MNNLHTSKIWLAMVVGLLAVTSGTWMHHPTSSNYDAPWVYPGNSH